ncbi:MAG: hypothetical protein KC657_30960 [Myxococcales bacterium]|nr:hypothetical protein [Myxococcales bacterium]
MWQVLGALVDFVHALLMAGWVLGLPLLFVHRWPRLTRRYGIFSVTFIALSLLSDLVIDECFLTTLARYLWQHPSTWGSPDAPTQEWFTVRVTRFIFHLTPTHESINLVAKILIGITAVGALVSIRKIGLRGKAPARSE